MVLLKVNFVDYTFEGAQTINLSSPFLLQDSLPIDVDFKLPTDFGYLKLIHQPNNDTLFQGVMIAIGTGGVIRPTFLAPTNFPNAVDSIAMLDSTRFQGLFNLQNIYPYEYAQVWNAIDKL